MPNYTIRVISDKEDVASPEEAVREFLKQVKSGEIMIDVFEGDDFDSKATADHQIYVSDLLFDDAEAEFLGKNSNPDG